MRETLFNWLREDVAGARCLDLFAGAGALGFEAASRGAKHVVMVERKRGVAILLESTARALDATNVEVVCADALSWRPPAGRAFDVVFLDPPYAGPAPEAALDRLDRLEALAPTASSISKRIAIPPPWSCLRGGGSCAHGAPGKWDIILPPGTGRPKACTWSSVRTLSVRSVTIILR